MPKRTINRILRAETTAVEGVMALLSTACGLFIMLPFDASSPPFEKLGRVAPEWAWGALLCLCGVFQFYTIKVSHRRLSVMAALLAGPCWVSVTVATVLSDSHALAAVVYGLAALVHLWLLLRAPTGAPNGLKGK